MTASTYLPELFAWLPEGGAVVNAAADGKSIGIVLDLETEDLTGNHFLELDLPAAEDLAAVLSAAIATAKEHTR